MNGPELRRLADDLSDGSDPADVPVGSVAETLSTSTSDDRRVAAHVLALAAGRRGSLVTDAVPALLDAAEADDAVVRTNAVRALGGVADHDPSSLASGTQSLVARLEDTEAGVRGAASDALAAIADHDPSSVRPHAGALLERVDDPVPGVRANAFRALGRLAATAPNSVADGVEPAIRQLDAGDSQVRRAALFFLSALVAERPAEVAPALDAVTTTLADPHGIHRATAAEICGRFGTDDPESVRPYAGRLVRLLDDPEELARRNALYALLTVGMESPTALVETGAGEHVLTLLETDIVAVQENAIRLLSLLVDHDPGVVARPTAVRTRLDELKTDPAIGVESDVVDEVARALRTVETGGPSRPRSDPADGGASTAPSAAESGSTPDRRDATTETSVFGSAGEDAGRTDADQARCPACGEALTDVDDPSFCPDCGEPI